MRDAFFGGVFVGGKSVKNQGSYIRICWDSSDLGF